MKLLLIILLILLIVYLIIFKKSKEMFVNNNTEILESILNNTYFINMDINKFRLNYLTKQLKDNGIKINRFKAYSGKNLNRIELINNNYLTKINILKDGQLGCAYSHCKLLEKIQNENIKYALILEDDVIIPKNFKKQIKNILNYLPNEWDLLYLGGCNIKGKLINKYFIKPTINNNLYNLCAHAYIINKKSINKILKIIKPMTIPIDNQLRDNFKNINVYFVNPNIIIQNKDIISTRRVLDGKKQSIFWKNNQQNISIIK
tara:strand:+ start:234 stop:1016 length:783 start_codon:yes stop_codon:yes gene_type:complete